MHTEHIPTSDTIRDIQAIATLGDKVLFVHRGDVPHIGKERALEVMCVKVDLAGRIIDAPYSLEKHLKFNPWEEVVDEEHREMLMRMLHTTFDDNVIQERIVDALSRSWLP